MTDVTQIEPCELDASCEALRQEIRGFLREAMRDVPVSARARNWAAYDKAFTRKLGEAGWIGVNWSKDKGARGLTALHRYVVLEELLAAGAPVHSHWVAERQSGNLLMRYAAPELVAEIVPLIVQGRCAFAIGMSEPNSGSDLASIRTAATRDGDEWVINGSKIWTSMAQEADYLIAIVRTAPRGENRHAGLSQFLVPLNTLGLTVRPIANMMGESHFNEVFFDNVRLPARYLIGREGDGWKQVTEELAFERSGPERYLSSTQLLLEMLDVADAGNEHEAVEIGNLVASYGALRQMSMGVAGMLADGQNPTLAAALVKEAGSNLEQAIPEAAYALYADREGLPQDFIETCNYITQAAPSFSLRGGTREILRGIIAKGLDLR